MRVIDVHSHYVPPELLAEARAGTAVDGVRTEVVDGAEWVVHRQGFRYRLAPSFHDVEARLAAMDAAGVDQAVVSVAPTLFMYWIGAGEAGGFCRLVNESLARFAAASGGRVTAVAALPMQDPDAAVAELRHAVTGLGLRGAIVGTSVGETPLDDPSLRGVLATAETLGVPLLVHPYPFGPRPSGTGEFYLGNLVGNPLVTTVCAARLILGGVLDELPGLAPVLMHGGGYLPYQIGRLDHGHRVRAEARGCRKEPSTYLPRFTYDTLTHAAAPLRFLIDLVGAERVVYGTDHAFDMGGGPLTEQLAGVEMDGGQRERIAWRNAAELFGMENRAG